MPMPHLTPADSAHITLTDARDPHIVSEARYFTEKCLTLWKLNDILDDAIIIVSELVTNLHTHTNSDGDLYLTNAPVHPYSPTHQRYSNILNIVVTDFDDNYRKLQGGYYTVHHNQPSDDLDQLLENHRGLFMIENLTSGRWGIDRDPLGKTIWASLCSKRK